MERRGLHRQAAMAAKKIKRDETVLQIIQKSFQVYNFRNYDIETHGAKFLQLSKGIVSVYTPQYEMIDTTRFPQFQWIKDGKLPTGKNKLYYIHPSSNNLSQVLGVASENKLEGKAKKEVERHDQNIINIVQEEP